MCTLYFLSWHLYIDAMCVVVAGFFNEFDNLKCCGTWGGNVLTDYRASVIDV